MSKQSDNYSELSKEAFELVGEDRVMHDQKFDTKPVGYFRDAFSRFARNKGSVFAAIVIGILIIYAIVGPYCCNRNYTSAYGNDKELVTYKRLRPRLSFMEGTGFWDGTKVKKNISQVTYDQYRAMEQERGCTIITELVSTYVKAHDPDDPFASDETYYTVRLDSYRALTTNLLTLTEEQYAEMQKWQDENEVQLILPRVNYAENESPYSRSDVWYSVTKQGGLEAKKDKDGNFIPNYVTKGTDMYTSKMRLESDPYNDGDTENAYRYAQRTGKPGSFNYVVRVDPYEYFVYKYGFEPSFVFGTNDQGYDIFSRLANGARFSLILAVCVSAINLIIGAIYGSIMGYYGGWIDILLDRIAEVLSGVPFMVVTVLFNLHLAHKVGIVPALFFAFVLTGWIGMAYRVRMQFYRFKNQEYVLAARTLGASDLRIMFKHIFPNSLGTIITGSVLVIPGVIFSETSLTYLGIINLNAANRASVGEMLSSGQACMTTDPHVVLFPAIFIGLLMVCFNLFGNGLRDAFNPSLRGVEE